MFFISELVYINTDWTSNIEIVIILHKCSFTKSNRCAGLAKQITVEIIVRGDIIDNNILRKYAMKLKEQSFTIDFTSSVAVPPFLVAAEKKYPSLAVLYATLNLENIFETRKLLVELAEEEDLEIISFKQL